MTCSVCAACGAGGGAGLYATDCTLPAPAFDPSSSLVIHAHFSQLAAQRRVGEAYFAAGEENFELCSIDGANLRVANKQPNLRNLHDQPQLCGDCNDARQLDSDIDDVVIFACLALCRTPYVLHTRPERMQL
jgi:hypothetical protein